jgi:succinate dehydrogenase / fumarate reductase flavoprotein subunit
MSESLRNDGRIWVPKKAGDTRSPDTIPEDERDYYLERMYPSYGNLCRRVTLPRVPPSESVTKAGVSGRKSAGVRRGVYLDFADAIRRLGKDTIRQRYGNLFDMYKKITGEDPYTVPMRIYPAVHYTMGGLWVDYNLMSNIAGLHVSARRTFRITVRTDSGRAR